MRFLFRLPHRFFTSLFLVLLSTAFFAHTVFASALNYDADTTIEFGSLNLVIKAGSTASIVTVNTSTLNVVTGPGDTFTITSPAFYEITSSPQQTTTCLETLSQVVVGADTTVTLTPTTTPCVTPAASGTRVREPEQPPYVEPEPVSFLQTSTVETTNTATTTTTTPVVEPPLFTSASYFSDLGELTEKQQKDVVNLTQYLIDHKTLFPIEKTKKYYPKHVLTYGYATQIANSFSPLGCGSNEYLGIHSCSQHAIKMGYLAKGHPVNSRIRRIDFYRLLLRAMGKKVLTKKNAVLQVAKYCSDSAGITVGDANVYLTARQYNIVTRFMSGKCQLSLYLPRFESANIGARVMARN